MRTVKALLLENIHSEANAILTAAGVEVETRPGALGEDELIAALKGVDLLGIRSATQLTQRVLEASPHLLAAGCFCIGTNQVNLKAAADLGIPVFNAPYSNTRSVVELAIGEAHRRPPALEPELEAGPTPLPCRAWRVGGGLFHLRHGS